MTTVETKNSQYRLYYNSDGTPKFYTMEDLPGEYITVDHETFESGRYDIKIKNKQIVNLSSMLAPRYVITEISSLDSVCCDPDDITLLVTDLDEHILWDYTSE